MAGNNLIVKISDGADIIEALHNFVKENGIEYCTMVGSQGRMKGFELMAQSSKGSIENIKSASDFDVSAISGQIEKTRSGNLKTNIKVSVTKTGCIGRSGQLLSGKASGDLEITVRKVDVGKIRMV